VGGDDAYLDPEQAARVYDRVGRWQDTQTFYERRAVDDMVRAGHFDRAASVVEVGCGTGALAARLLTRSLPTTSRYVGLDVSARMVALSRQRLRPWVGRVEVVRVDGRSAWPVPDGGCDRVVATYVLDLMAPSAIAGVFAEARRVLEPGGLLAATSLAPATSGASRLVSGAWTRLWRVNPRLTGGCRPIELVDHLPAGWRVEHSSVVSAFAICSGVLIASRA
jgi:ubiquinone/menaquinone biosynthesis C-methylase UbiE